MGALLELMNWHIVTSEYPPQPGGVSDYTKHIAAALAAAGDEVHVWCPADQRSEVRGQRSVRDRESEATESQPEKLIVHREFGRFAPADLRRVGRALDQFPTPRRLLVQWVAQGYGYRSINLPFCWWLWRRAKLAGDRIELMVHEPFLAFGEGSKKQDFAAAAQRLMVVVLLQAASRIWVSIPDWEKRLRPFAFGSNKPFGWLPVPSSIPVLKDPNGISQTRTKYASNGTRLVGHFAAYDSYMTELMLKLLPSLQNDEDEVSVLLIGKGSLELRARIVDSYPKLSARIHASGALNPEDVSRHVSACDVMLQPYQDGVSGRRTSIMTALSHGVPVVTTIGKATEKCWVESQAVQLSKVDDVAGMVDMAMELLADESERCRLSAAGRALYGNHFDLTTTIAALRGTLA